MTQQTLRLLNLSLKVRGDENKKKTLSYLKRALEELQEEILRLEDNNQGEQNAII